jgi:hypothetical protein
MHDEIPTLYTGGATGADKEWIEAAKNKGHFIKIYRFDGVSHTRIETYNPSRSTTHITTENIDTIDNKNYEHECKTAMQRAAEHIKTVVPSDAYTRNLINRDYYLTQHASSLYAIGSFCTKGRLRIDGHTGWIVEMFVDKIVYGNTDLKSNGNLPVYFLCQETEKWYQLYYDESMHFNWVHIKKPEEPKGKYIGVGSRDLSMRGKLEIMYL